LVKASIKDTNDCYLKSFANDKRFVVSDHLHQSATALKKNFRSEYLEKYACKGTKNTN